MTLKNYHLYHSASHMPNPSSLLDHGFDVLNSYQEQESAYPGFATSINVAMHLVETHKS